MYYQAIPALDQRCLPTLLPNQPRVVSCVALNHITVKTDAEEKKDYPSREQRRAFLSYEVNTIAKAAAATGHKPSARPEFPKAPAASLVVVPLGRVPFRKIVFLPF